MLARDVNDLCLIGCGDIFADLFDLPFVKEKIGSDENIARDRVNRTASKQNGLALRSTWNLIRSDRRWHRCKRDE